ncbi:MAG: class I SAM-dependent methyltransferase [Atopobiaceae bacterium]
MDQRFDGVPNTLFIPLWARIEASKRFPEFLFDSRALELEPALTGHALAGTTSEFNLLSSAARAHVMDTMAEEFCAAHGPSSIIILGCGLDTASSRIETENSTFFELDLPDVIAYRRQVLGQAPNEHLIACDLFDTAWTDEVPHEHPVLIYAAGIFQYFEEDRIVSLLQSLKQIFPGSELIFDCVDSRGLRYAERYVRETGNASAAMHFAVDDPEAFADKAGVALVECEPFFGDARKLLKSKVGLCTKLSMQVSDRQGRLKVIHVRL